MSSKSDASKKILGFKYQEMVALKECFEAKDNTKIYLECFGDVSDGKVSTEVKHSIDDNKKLINTHIDFWKTLSNIIDEYDTYRFYDKFIFHTTAEIKKGSSFEDWETLTKKQKLKNVISIKPNDTIKNYVEKVNLFDKNKLENILDKFIIRDKQESAKDYYKNILISHPAVATILAEKDREPFICYLFGYISQQLINSINFVWVIDINDFRINSRSFARNYQIADMTFPVSNIVVDESTNKSFRFVSELKAIKYDKAIGKAMNDYLKAKDSQIQMIQSRRSLIDALDGYDDNIKSLVEDLKIGHHNRLTIFNSLNINDKSRRFYDESIIKISSHTKIDGVSNIRSYYPNGRLHQNVEDDSNFKWKLK